MTILRKIRDLFIPSTVDTKLIEAAGVTVDNDDEGWRQLGDKNKKRDLSPMRQDRMQEMAAYLWESNLLANRIIELPLAFLLAEGVKIVADDESVQDLISKFWSDPINNLDIKLIKKVRELAIFGEQCWPTFVNEVNGHVRLGYLDPSLIETVVTDPDNGEQPIGIITKKDKKGQAKRYKIIVNGAEADLFTHRTQLIRETFDSGECFYFAINDLSNGARGRSDLLSQFDWLDMYDQFLFGEIDRADFMRSFLWDVTMANATPDEVKTRASELTAPSPGSIRVHNDSETWKAETPDLKSEDASTGARLIRNHILSGSSLPEHWYGGGGDVNRSTSESMDEPTFKLFTMRQTYIGYMLKTVIQYVIRQNELAQYSSEPDLSEDVYQFEMQWPEMVSSDLSKYAQALSQVVMAVAHGITNKLFCKETGLQIIEKITARLGVEFDASEELDEILKDIDEEKKKDVYSQGGNGELKK